MKAGTIIYGAMGALLLVFLVFAFQDEALPVDTVRTDRGPVTTWVRDDGFTRIREIYQINAPVSGHLLRLPKEPGEAVVAGETIIASIMQPRASFRDDRSLRELTANVGAAEAGLQVARDDIRRAEAEVTYAESEIARVEPLVESGTISRARLDAAILQRDRARASLDAAKSAERQRKATLDVALAAVSGPTQNGQTSDAVIHVKAPVSGQVLSMAHESEGVIQAGMPILELGDPLDLEIIADFLSQKLVGLAPGTKAIIEGWGGEPFEGRLKLIEPKGFTKFSALGVEEQRVNIIVDFDRADVPVGENASGLLHGYRVDVKLVTWEAEDVLRVPISALFRDADGNWAVFRYTDDEAEVVKPDIGHVNDTHAEVLTGLSADDELVAWPSRDLQDGVKITRR